MMLTRGALLAVAAWLAWLAWVFFELVARGHVTGPELVVAGPSVPNLPEAAPNRAG